MVRAALVAIPLLLGAAGCGGSSATPPTRAPDPVAGHPRLLIRESDVGRLRSWASSRNPMWAKGIRLLAREAKAAMDAGHVPDDDKGSDAYDEYTTEAYSELFAFMSLIAPSERDRADYGRRARDLLMAVMEEAERGAGDQDERFRDSDFSTGDRSRWNGEAFALTVDWAYPYFSKDDKRRIRKVFLRWSREQFDAYPLDFVEGARPSPNGRAKDPALIANREGVRESLNNYYLAHARNLGLMAMALDARDDPGGRLRRHLGNVTGQWLHVIDHALRTDARGGLSPEGFQYGPEAVGRVAQLLHAMRTAGQDGATIAGNPFWAESITAFLSSLPPRPTRLQGESAYVGDVWQPAWYVSAQDYYAGDPITLFGPVALAAADRGDRKTLDAIRWIETYVPPGGREQLHERVGSTDQFFAAILYFLIFEPGASPPSDPRPELPTRHFAPGLNRTLARTCWCADARLFTHKLSWNQIDHQIADGNDFGFLRRGEWLTKQRALYSSGYIDYTNTLAIRNDVPKYDDAGDQRHLFYLRGGQWEHDPAGDPALRARSFGDGFVALTGDATNLYNSDYEGVHDVRHASRSIVWLEPDHVVVYDRATTGKAGRFKRFWLQLPTAAQISGRRATARTARGQQLFVTSLLPASATLTGLRDENVGEPANQEPMRFRLRIEDTRSPTDVRFLTVLQGADARAQPDPATLLRSSSGAAYDGVTVAGNAVLFPVDMETPAAAVTVELPAAGLERIIVTGLEPGGEYAVAKENVGDKLRLSVARGDGAKADGGGVLVVRQG